MLGHKYIRKDCLYRILPAYSNLNIDCINVVHNYEKIRLFIEECDSYLYLMLATATVPLVLQALSGVSGGLYGWWLIIEQIVFLIIGMEIKKKFVTMWGLYVAVGAVLYQLRGLGWAALAFLAIFLIGLAVYKIQKNSDK